MVCFLKVKINEIVFEFEKCLSKLIIVIEWECVLDDLLVKN